jgi:hypothetical protein
MSIRRALVFSRERSERHEERRNSLELVPQANVPDPVQEADSPGSTIDWEDIRTTIDLSAGEALAFQNFETSERRCQEMAQLNEYVRAFFANVHPLLPVLHYHAFLTLYRLYGLKVVRDPVTDIMDPSSREGRAVALICAVLALGAMSLVERTEFKQSGMDEVPFEEKVKVRLPHYGEALGFYRICLRLMFYTHNTIETMITLLLMVIQPLSKANLRAPSRSN